jgi:hypothetical protein
MRGGERRFHHEFTFEVPPGDRLAYGHRLRKPAREGRDPYSGWR